MQKIKSFLKNHSYVSLSWSSDIWHIIPNITLIYHEYSIGLSFSFEWLKLYFWSEFNLKSYEN